MRSAGRPAVKRFTRQPRESERQWRPSPSPRPSPGSPSAALPPGTWPPPSPSLPRRISAASARSERAPSRSARRLSASRFAPRPRLMVPPRLTPRRRPPWTRVTPPARAVSTPDQRFGETQISSSPRRQLWDVSPFFPDDAVTSRPRDARCDRRDPPRMRAMARPRRPRIVRSRLDRIAPREDRPARPSPAAAFSWFRALVDPVWIRRAPHWQHGQEKADEKNPRKTQPLADLPRPPIPSVQQLAVAVAVAVAVAAGPRATVSPRTSSRCSA